MKPHGQRQGMLEGLHEFAVWERGTYEVQGTFVLLRIGGGVVLDLQIEHLDEPVPDPCGPVWRGRPDFGFPF